MQRRPLLLGSGLGLGLATLAGLPRAARAAAATAFAETPPLARIRAQPDRLVDIAVCTRPFRPAGPRLEAERVRDHVVVHHYGHGGSGWSLSWGSAQEVLPLILATRQHRIAVVGCGAIGLTTARVAQRAGLRVRILAKERPPEVRSSAATGAWTPDSRLARAEAATPAFQATWERMARRSFKVWQSMLGLPGEPVHWYDGYTLSDVPFDQPVAGPEDAEPDYAELEHLIRDLRPHSVVLPDGAVPFRAPHARRFTNMAFNLATYQRLLLEDFLREGGELVTREFHSLRELATLPERCVVNCTGYGARALAGDDSIVPVRGQTARLIPQPEVDYGLYWRGHNLSVVPRRDGILVQAQGAHDFGNDDARPDRAQSEEAVRRLATLFP